MILWIYLPLYTEYTEILESFFLEPYEEKTSYTFLGGVLFIYIYPNERSREGRDLRKVGFYDPIQNQTYLNVPAIRYFLEKGAQPTGTVHDILRKAEFFKESAL